MSEDFEPDRVLDSERLRLLKERLGPLFSWKAPVIVRTIGPFDPSVFEHYADLRQDLFDRCMTKLRSYSDDDIAVILQNAMAQSPIFRELDTRGPVEEEWSNFLVTETHDLRRRMPVWYAGGFGHPDHVADFDYWAKMPGFTDSELACLSVGISPTEFSGKQLKEFSQSKERAKFLKSLGFLVQQFELITRSFDLYHRNAMPEDIIEWVDQFEVPMHPGFLEPLRKYHNRNDRTPSVNAKPNKREIDSISKIITVMAIQKFRYDPQAARSEVPKKIVDLAAEKGIQISEDTVLKYLRRGASFIPKAGQAE